MALTPDQQNQVEQLKKYLGGANTYTDDQLWAMLQSGESPYAIASRIWGEYAAKTATLIDMSEGSSRRNLGDLYEQAMKMSQYWADLDASTDPDDGGATKTFLIKRPR